MLTGLGQAAAPALLVELRELPAQGDRSIRSTPGGEILHSGSDAVRGLVDHHRHPGRGDLPETIGSRPSLAGKEPLEGEPAGTVEQTAQHRCCGTGERSGHHLERNARCERSCHHFRTGIRQARHAGIGHDRDPLAPRRGVHQ